MKSVEYYLGLNYRTSVYRDDEGDFIVKVAELPGCIADGKTPNEAFDNVKSAMRSWIESRMQAGLEVPEPRSTEEFSGRVLLRMPRYLHERLSQQAETEGVSLNQYMVSLLSEASAVAQAPQNQPTSVANAAPWQGITDFVYQTACTNAMLTNPYAVIARRLAGRSYFCNRAYYRVFEDWQENLVLPASVRTSVAQESEREPVPKLQIAPKQQVA